MLFSYIFMHYSVLNVDLKYHEDKVCFNNNFEPPFELIVL